MRKSGGTEGDATGVLWRVVSLSLCVCLGASALFQGPVCAAELQIPDNLYAGNMEFSPEGIITASGGATLLITSLVEGATISVTADEVEYDTVSGVAELWGDVVIRLEEYDLEVTCDYFLFDPLMERMEVEGVRLVLPLTSVVEEGRLPADFKLTATGNHLYNFIPEGIYLASGSAFVDVSNSGGSFVMHNVRLTHHPDPDPDLYLQAGELRLLNGGKVSVKDIALRISGFEIFSWPRITRSTRPSPRLISFDFPQFRIDRKVGIRMQQGVKLDLEPFKTDVLLDISPDYGTLAYGYSYTEPSPNSTLGVTYGIRTLRNVDRLKIERRDDFNAVYRQSFDLQAGMINSIDIEVEYGKITSTTLETRPEEVVEDTRQHASGSMDFIPVRIADNLFIASGGQASYTNYEDADETYAVVGGSVGLVWRQPDFDHFVQYKAFSIKGDDDNEPVMPFDKVRRQELSFATSFRLHPEWRHVIRGIYDVEEEDFDLLQVGAMKRQRTYEIGLYFDIARENIGIELGLLFD